MNVFKQLLVVVVGLLFGLGVATGAFAAVPADVVTALGTAKADAVSVGTIMLGVIAALLGIAYIRRQMH